MKILILENIIFEISCISVKISQKILLMVQNGKFQNFSLREDDQNVGSFDLTWSAP